ncbi:division/cell wall cluster transcriptional repressor MraZ [Sulfobacillus sp. hq2]|uniref:Transcriptional regulator MraZ n=1 Tax=Sulfobacillus thermotolerans TaxID=338644 RepID=A0ABN5H208_9FIRM|nr:division/cell wall cluster transcriptional repressor MraZ [Sulfobacillus sp. hq2]AUW94382.1 cell division/cell wall cluster transcriptional repressor MraZ [Sulfobacillus thermotolerans]MCY0908307.1 division/cell wall cluster transcriptional repressor MraZ [Sulfobacillus thermotolerans]POB09353.1 cell division/cell wall cluster transcriptional repressor MraZ [Sulfobacillus sp. hq2]
MLMGEYEHSLDDKGRVTIPSRLRDDLQTHFVITKGLDGCLFLYPMEEWGKMEERLKSLPMTNANARAFARLFLAGAQDVEVDKQFRVVIPPRLREHAGIEKEVVLVGVSTRVELWARERWEGYQAEAQTSYEEIAEKMVDFGF